MMPPILPIHQLRCLAAAVALGIFWWSIPISEVNQVTQADLRLMSRSSAVPPTSGAVATLQPFASHAAPSLETRMHHSGPSRAVKVPTIPHVSKQESLHMSGVTLSTTARHHRSAMVLALVMAATGSIFWWMRKQNSQLQYPVQLHLCATSGESGEPRVDKGFDLLGRAGKLVPQGALVGTTKASWKFVWTRMMTELAPRDASGNYQRPKYAFTGRIGSAAHPLESGRYHVYLGNPCPWCHRVSLVIALRGLQEEGHITTSRLLDDPIKASRGGWAFSSALPDPVFGATDLLEVYDRLSPGFSGRCTAPLLIDKKARRIVSNESADIVQMLSSIAFSDSAKGRRDLRPVELVTSIDETNEWVYRQLNNGVYRCGFATTQEAYNAASADVRAGLRRVEELLSKQPFLCGSHITEADVRLLPTVVRFDAVYAPFFKAGGVHLRIRDYPSIYSWMRRCWALEDLSSTFDLADAQGSYYKQLFPLSPGSIVPTPPTLADIGLSELPKDIDPQSAFVIRST